MLSVKALTIARGSAPLVDALDCDLAASETLVLTGANGTGKTSFLRALAGLLKPQNGTVTAPAFHWISAQNLAPALETVSQYLAFHAALLKAPAQNTTPDPFNIAQYADTQLNRLSTGWRQRVKLSRLLLEPRPLWLLDEPSDGLDDAGTQTLQYLLQQHAKNGGIAVIATHQPQLWPNARTLNFMGAE